MNIGELLAPDAVVLRGGVPSKRQALHLVAETAARAYGLDASQAFDALMEREALGSTGLGNGVGAPHARTDAVSAVRGVLVRLDTPIAYESVDDRPVDILFALFAPPRDGAEHLRALAAVSRGLRSAELRQRIRQASTVDALHALFVEERAATAA